MKNKMTLTVGIAAYNEEKSIARTVAQVLSQSSDWYQLKKILIVSDGSSDGTVKKVRQLKDSRIQIAGDSARKGKALRLNEILRQSTTDLVILLDADIILKSHSVFDKLVRPFYENGKVVLTSGHLEAINPKTFVQRVVMTGHQLWNVTRQPYFGNGAYYCAGPLRAMSKKIYSQLEFPQIASEDIYPYLFNKFNSIGEYVFVPAALVLYKLPETLFDYLKQMRRYLSSIPEQGAQFPEEFLKSQFFITGGMKIQVIIREWL